VLVHALPIVTATSLVGDDAARSRERAMAGALHGLAGLLGACRIRAVVRRGPVADVLASAANRVRARLICIGRDEIDALRTRRIVERLLERSAAGVAVVPRKTLVDATGAPGPVLYEASRRRRSGGRGGRRDRRRVSRP
jgi:hypothetical protein